MTQAAAAVEHRVAELLDLLESRHVRVRVTGGGLVARGTNPGSSVDLLRELNELHVQSPEVVEEIVRGRSPTGAREEQIRQKRRES